MTVQLVTAVQDRTALRGSTYQLALAMADQADHEHCCHVSEAVLARKAHLDIKTVQRRLQTLQTAGVIRAIGQSRSGDTIWRFTILDGEQS